MPRIYIPTIMNLTYRTVLRHLFASVAVLTFFASCQKEVDAGNEPTPPPATSPHLTSIYDHNSTPGSGSSKIDSFSYNGAGYMTRIQEWQYDTTSTSIIMTDSAHYLFAFSSPDAPPSSYTLSSMTAGVPNPTEKHLLYYDSKNRLVKDSLLNGPFILKYTYVPNYIVTQHFLKDPFGYMYWGIDSLLISASNNRTSITFCDSAAKFGSIKLYTYTNDINPCYDKTLAESIGVWLTRITDYDFNSKNAYASITRKDNFGTSYSIPFAVVLDAKGRVIESHQVGKTHYQTFRYNY